MAGFLSDNFIQRVLDETDIVSLIDSFVPLQKKGKDHWSLCPFCEDGNNPSFSVSSQKQFYYCFRCRASGNAIGFLMNYQSKEFLDAIETLATNAGLELPQRVQGESFEKYKKIVEANFISKDFYVKQITDHPGGPLIKEYLNNRGISDEVIHDFELGFSPPGWSNLHDYFLKIDKKDFIKNEVGLFKKNDKNKIYDTFRNRIIFPIKSMAGRIQGFGGRILSSKAKTAKYLNSPESKIYNKSKILYGIFEAKKQIANEAACYLVEGYTDVIQMHQSGIKNVVSSSGTALTYDQILLIRRVTNNIVVLFDGDEAGLKASERGLEMILEMGMDVKVCQFPESEDPDNFVKNRSKDDVLDF